MKTLHQLKAGRETDAQYVERLSHAAAALVSMNDVQWQVVLELFERTIAEANDMATDPACANRDYYAGGERVLRELWQEFEDLRSGDWKEREQMGGRDKKAGAKS